MIKKHRSTFRLLFLSGCAAALTACASYGPKLEAQSPFDLAADAERRVDTLTGVTEILAPEVRPRLSGDLDGVMRLRTAGDFTDDSGVIQRGGAYLDLAFGYSTADDDPAGARTYDRVTFAGGETALLAEFGTDILDCRETVEEYTYDNYYYPIYGRGGYHPRRRGGHWRRGRHGDGWGGRGTGRRGGGRGPGRRGTGDDDGTGKKGKRKRKRGTGVDDTHVPVMRVDPGDPGRKGRRTGRKGKKKTGTTAPRRPVSRPAPRPTTGRTSRPVRRTPSPVSRPAPKPAPAPRRTPVSRPTPKPAPKPAPKRVSKPAPRESTKTSRPNRSSRSSKSGRFFDRFAPDHSASNTMTQLMNQSSTVRMGYFPRRGSSYQQSEYYVSFQCLREERLRVFIPEDRLRAAERDGMVLYIRSLDGREDVLAVPPNYVRGFMIAAYGPQTGGYTDALPFEDPDRELVAPAAPAQSGGQR